MVIELLYQKRSLTNKAELLLFLLYLASVMLSPQVFNLTRALNNSFCCNRIQGNRQCLYMTAWNLRYSLSFEWGFSVWPPNCTWNMITWNFQFPGGVFTTNSWAASLCNKQWLRFTRVQTDGRRLWQGKETSLKTLLWWILDCRQISWHVNWWLPLKDLHMVG